MTNCNDYQDEIEDLKERVEALENTIRAAKGECLAVRFEALETLEKKSGVARAEWAFAKAARVTAIRIVTVLNNQ